MAILYNIYVPIIQYKMVIKIKLNNIFYILK